jgi:hypothetical protein
MAEKYFFFLSLLQKKKNFFCAMITQLTQTPNPHNRGLHRIVLIFPLSPIDSLVSPQEISFTHNSVSKGPYGCSHMIKHEASTQISLLEIRSRPSQLRDFGFHDFMIPNVKGSCPYILRNPNCRTPMHSTKVEFKWASHFIGISEFTIS